jgi:hypothetical protein
MRPMLDDLELPQVQEAAIGEQRALAEHHAPHADGSVLQDLGRHAARVRLWGVATGPDAAAFVEKLASKFRAGEPVPFTADITSGAAIERMSIADLQLREAAGKPDRWVYALALDEYIEPPPAVSPAAGVDAGVLDEAAGLMDGLAGALDLAPLFATGLEPFVEQMQGFLTRLSEFRQASG